MTRNFDPETDERFLWIELSMSSREPTMMTVFDRPRRGCGLVPLRSARLLDASLPEIAHHAAAMCSEYGCKPLMEVTREGANVLNRILGLLG